VGQPRDGNPLAAFGLVDTDTRVFEQIRVPYPVEKAAKRILEAGLPTFLAERLALGR
jgi:diadenosine tetraphosphatase ApaH/serine/threonine PP2A family protein phosphatase